MSNIGIELYDSGEQTVTIRRVAKRNVSSKKRKDSLYNEPMLEIHCISIEEYDKLQEAHRRLIEEMNKTRNRIGYKQILDKIRNLVK